MYNHISEKWWIPFQSHWLHDNEEWMAERRKLWKVIRANVKGRESVMKQRGLRNLFTTGYLFSERPPRVDMNGIINQMNVAPRERLFLAPFSKKSHYNAYIKAVNNHGGDRGLAEVMTPFRELTIYYKGTEFLHSKAQEIYKYVLGGGTFYDNKRLLKNKRALAILDVPYRLHEYFFNISILLQLTTSGDEESYWIYEELFDYYTTMADYLTEHEDHYKEAMLSVRGLSLSFEHFANPCILKDDRSQALYHRSREFIYSGRLPKAMRVD